MYTFCTVCINKVYSIYIINYMYIYIYIAYLPSCLFISPEHWCYGVQHSTVANFAAHTLRTWTGNNSLWGTALDCVHVTSTKYTPCIVVIIYMQLRIAADTCMLNSLVNSSVHNQEGIYLYHSSMACSADNHCHQMKTALGVHHVRPSIDMCIIQL